MRGQEPSDSVRYMFRRKRRACDVSDVRADLHLCAVAFAQELRAPLRVADLAAVAFAIFEDLDPGDGAARVEAQGVGDELVLADDLVDDDPAPRRDPPGAQPRR